MEEEEEDDINLKAMTVKGHSGHQAHEIEDKVAEYGIDVLQHVRHDGSRLYQLVVLTLTGTKYNYTNIVAKTPIVWTLCSTSNRSELERYNARDMTTLIFPDNRELFHRQIKTTSNSSY